RPSYAHEDAFQVAEDLLQEALAKALVRWPEDGVPENPGAWIMRVAKNGAIDRLRRQGTRAQYLEELRTARLSEAPAHPFADAGDPDAESPGDSADLFEDERLRLFFTCCHPALSRPAQ